MGREVDILEREESYKRRVNRLVTILGTVVLIGVGTGWYLIDRQEKNLKQAEEHAEEMKRQAEIKALRAAYSADSASAHTRFTEFMEKYEAEKAQGASLFLIELPSSRSVPSFLSEVWTDYANTVEPGITDEAKMDLFRLHYVDSMNLTWFRRDGSLEFRGEMRPTSILVPEMRFKLTRVEMQKTTFPQVARAQIDAGLKIDPNAVDETAPADADSMQAETEPMGETASAP